jgi:hypothetical protein
MTQFLRNVISVIEFVHATFVAAYFAIAVALAASILRRLLQNGR